MDARIQAIAHKFGGHIFNEELSCNGGVEQAIKETGRILAEISKDTGCQCGACVKTKTVTAIAILTAVGIDKVEQ